MRMMCVWVWVCLLEEAFPFPSLSDTSNSSSSSSSGGETISTIRIRLQGNAHGEDEVFDCSLGGQVGKGGDVVMIGRLPACHVRLRNTGGSRLHALVFVVKELKKLAIVDVGSLTGIIMRSRSKSGHYENVSSLPTDRRVILIDLDECVVFTMGIFTVTFNDKDPIVDTILPKTVLASKSRLVPPQTIGRTTTTSSSSSLFTGLPSPLSSSSSSSTSSSSLSSSSSSRSSASDPMEEQHQATTFVDLVIGSGSDGGGATPMGSVGSIGSSSSGVSG